MVVSASPPLLLAGDTLGLGVGFKKRGLDDCQYYFRVFYSYSITGPKNLILIVKAPMVGLGLSVEYMGLP